MQNTTIATFLEALHRLAQYRCCFICTRFKNISAMLPLKNMHTQRKLLALILMVCIILSISTTIHIVERQPTYVYEKYCPPMTSHSYHSNELSPKTFNHSRTVVAMVLALTTRGLSPKYTRTVRQMPLFESLMKSFCKSCSSGYHYPFYVAYDIDDYCMLNESFVDTIRTEFRNYTITNCPNSSSYTIDFLHCNHSHHVAWAQNDAMMLAYESGADYMYRVNDDTVFESGNWTEIFIQELAGFQPPNVGIVGPMHKNGNLRCLTYEFIHRTHIDILGFHYPRNFTDWDADVWITAIYQPGRVTKVKNVTLLHTMQLGVRYNHHQLIPNNLRELINDYRDIISSYVGRLESKLQSNSGVIAVNVPQVALDTQHTLLKMS